MLLETFNCCKMQTTLFRLVVKFLIGTTVCLSFLDQVSAQSARYEEAFSAYQSQNFSDAEVAWIELAGNGDVNAQYALGVMHLRQEASDSSPAAAFSWFEKAASQGHSTAMFNLGVAYWEGTGVEKNKDQALKLWEQSAQKGDSGAQFNLGLAYYIGEERAPDIKTAEKWISLAAEQDHPEAKRILGVIQSELDGGQQAIVTTSQTLTEGSADVSDVNQVDGEEKLETASLSTSSDQSSERFWKTINQTTTAYHKPDGVALLELPAGTPIDVIGQDGGWARFSLPDGLRTWIYSKFITIDGEHGVINADAVRVRPRPSTDNESSPPLGQYKRGERVSVVNEQGDWTEIRAPKNIGAWLMVTDILEYRDSKKNRQLQWEQSLADGM
jgi:SH3-like domain-containing protein